MTLIYVNLNEYANRIDGLMIPNTRNQITGEKFINGTKCNPSELTVFAAMG